VDGEGDQSSDSLVSLSDSSGCTWWPPEILIYIALSRCNSKHQTPTPYPWPEPVMVALIPSQLFSIIMLSSDNEPSTPAAMYSSDSGVERCTIVGSRQTGCRLRHFRLRQPVHVHPPPPIVDTACIHISHQHAKWEMAQRTSSTCYSRA